MDRNQIDAFFDGMCMDAYTLFGAQKAFEHNCEGYRFTLWAPHANGIQIIINNRDIYYMDKVDIRGIWSQFIPHVQENDLYFYRIKQVDDKVVGKLDPFAFSCEKVNGVNARIVSHAYAWKDTDWMNRRDKNYDKPVNIYEVYMGAWKEEYTSYRSLAKPLIEYVKAHHYTHIECMPLHEHPYDGSWGYQVSGMYSPTCRYGSLDDFKYFVDQCHQAGIGVIIDFVPIHFATDEFGLNNFDGTPLYEYLHEEDAYSQWGTANFDLCKEEVRSFLISAASYWIEELHVDGLRNDAISHAIYWQGNPYRGENDGALDFMKRMNSLLSKKYPGVMLMAEDSTAYPNVTKPVEKGGLGFDYKWDMGWMNDTLRYLERDPIYRKWHHHDITFSMAYFYSERFLLPFSHDEVVHEKRTILNKLWGSYDNRLKQGRMLYTYMYTHPGKKLNFMGNEMGMLREFDERKELDWIMLENKKHVQFNAYIKALSSLYFDKKALYENEYSLSSFEWIDADNCDENLYSYMRKGKDSTIIVILNMAPVAHTKHPFGVHDKGVYKEILNSDDTIYGGSGFINKKRITAKKKLCNNKPYTIEVDVAPFAGIVLEHKKG